MGSDVEQQSFDIHSRRRNDHFQASQGFLIEASPVLLRPLLEGSVNWLRDVLQGYAFHGVTISQPLRLSTANVGVRRACLPFYVGRSTFDVGRS